MAKVYISFLGTNDYLPCTYIAGGNEVKNIRFVQESTIIQNCENWKDTDKIFVFTTKESKIKNWDDNGHKNYKTKEILERKGLCSCLKSLNLLPVVQNVHIPEGKSETEIWDIFNIVFNKLNNEDEIIFDITHAFRSIPMIAIAILNYAKAMKDVKLLGIFYGAFEVLGSIHEAKNTPVEKRRVPILDLTALDQIIEWSYATDRFVKSGDAGHLSSLAYNSARSILSSTKGKDRSQHKIRMLAESLENFTKNLSTCRGRNISASVLRLKENVEACEKLEFNKPLNQPLKPIFKRIKKQTELFSGDTILDGIQAAKWCLEHNLIQQGYTILAETLISFFIYKATGNQEEINSKIRTLVGSSSAFYKNNIPYEKWNIDSKDNRKIINTIINYFQKKPELLKIYNDLIGFRNDINHAGYREDDRPFKTFEKKLSDFIREAEKEIKNG